MRILPFTVGALELVHTEGAPELDRQARGFWRVLSDKALLQYRKQNDTRWCRDEEDFPGGGRSITFVFAVFDVDGRGNRGSFVGTWGLYKVARVDDRPPGVITALVAPMLPEILDEGNDLSRIVAINNWFLDHELETDDPRVSIRLVKRRRSTDAGATILSLGHCRKHRGPTGGPVGAVGAVQARSQRNLHIRCHR